MSHFVELGLVALVFAWLTAGFIPDQARHDFDRLVRAAGGSLSHTPTFPDTYIQMSSGTAGCYRTFTSQRPGSFVWASVWLPGRGTSTLSLHRVKAP